MPTTVPHGHARANHEMPQDKAESATGTGATAIDPVCGVKVTRVVKIFLHLSKDEQRKRFLGRIDDPTKNWKFTASDMTERGFWDAD